MAMSTAERSRLGRGLAALIGDVGDETAVLDRARGGQRKVPIEFLRPNPRNPRRSFHEEELSELAASIGEKGILQPILVRGVAGKANHYEIVAGERRWRAAQKAGLREVPVLFMEISDREALEIAIVENVQRADLNPLEEAAGYGSLIDEFKYTQADLARSVGKSRSHVANTLRLQKLPPSVKRYLAEGKLTAGHARALLAHEDPEGLAKMIVEQGLNVREAEARAQERPVVRGKQTRRRVKPSKSADIRAVERKLSDALGLAVDIVPRGSGGEVRIRYKTLEQFEAFSKKLGGRH
ncbi:MAG TPA: ParB/RepB/Spo0J family partition protein [Xanthobacteraceae bacterium]|nr:ParB/RepB/Spo0J family partition protein [Xanthobacteraceae bacterium]